MGDEESQNLGLGPTFWVKPTLAFNGRTYFSMPAVLRVETPGCSGLAQMFAGCASGGESRITSMKEQFYASKTEMISFEVVTIPGGWCKPSKFQFQATYNNEVVGEIAFGMPPLPAITVKVKGMDKYTVRFPAIEHKCCDLQECLRSILALLGTFGMYAVIAAVGLLVMFLVAKMGQDGLYLLLVLLLLGALAYLGLVVWRKRRVWILEPKFEIISLPIYGPLDTIEQVGSVKWLSIRGDVQTVSVCVAGATEADHVAITMIAWLKAQYDGIQEQVAIQKMGPVAVAVLAYMPVQSELKDFFDVIGDYGKDEHAKRSQVSATSQPSVPSSKAPINGEVSM